MCFRKLFILSLIGIKIIYLWRGDFFLEISKYDDVWMYFIVKEVVKFFWEDRFDVVFVCIIFIVVKILFRFGFVEVKNRK